MARTRAPALQDTVRLSAEGLAKVLGDLEARLLKAIWALGEPVPARAVHTAIAKDHQVALLTVITVLNKLVRKGILRRAKRHDLFHYEARYSEPEFLSMASQRVVEGIYALGPEAVATSFVDVVARHDPSQLEELGRLVRKRLREQSR
ncbi:MAG: BlaI/MecI/CopY family transcriptional regulator [Gemmatimonadaceae bacterium]